MKKAPSALAEETPVSPRIQSTNRQLIRQINEAVVLGIIHDNGPISRTEIADLANLSPATITGIMGALLRRGLVREQESGPSTGGRPRVLVEFARDAGCVIGIKLTETQLIGALTDLSTETIAQQILPLGADRSPEAVVAELERMVNRLRAEAPERRFLGVGIGLAGAIDRRAGICRFSPYLPWRDVPLRSLLEARIGTPVVIENDVSALILAERRLGGADLTDFLVVTLGRGIGLGMVLDGKPYRGGHGAGGEFGHMTMDPHGPRCDCGKYGCLEALVSQPALTRRISEVLGRETTLADGAMLARNGDESVRAIFRSAGETLGLALAAVINVLNPTRVTVGGEGIEMLDLMLEPMRAALTAHCFDGLFDDINLIVAPWGDDAWARGAAGLVLDDLFHARLDIDAGPLAPGIAV
jgi:predicted NBD/HSP70 family sugar kinase/predicted transcriptional regulator